MAKNYVDAQGYLDVAEYFEDNKVKEVNYKLRLGKHHVQIPYLGGHLKTGHAWTSQNRPRFDPRQVLFYPAEVVCGKADSISHYVLS